MFAVRLIDDATENALLASARGKSIQFPVEDVREVGRGAQGVRGMDLMGDELVGMEVVAGGQEGPPPMLLSVTANGYGKRTALSEYRTQGRGGKGIKTVNRTERTGNVVALLEVLPEDEIMLITRGGQIIRSPVKDVRVAGRNTQGVKLMNLDMGDVITAVARVVPEDNTEGDAGDQGDDGDGASPDGQLELTTEEE